MKGALRTCGGLCERKDGTRLARLHICLFVRVRVPLPFSLAAGREPPRCTLLYILRSSPDRPPPIHGLAQLKDCGRAEWMVMGPVDRSSRQQSCLGHGVHQVAGGAQRRFFKAETFPSYFFLLSLIWHTTLHLLRPQRAKLNFDPTVHGSPTLSRCTSRTHTQSLQTIRRLQNMHRVRRLTAGAAAALLLVLQGTQAEKMWLNTYGGEDEGATRPGGLAVNAKGERYCSFSFLFFRYGRSMFQ